MPESNLKKKEREREGGRKKEKKKKHLSPHPSHTNQLNKTTVM